MEISAQKGKFTGRSAWILALALQSTNFMFLNVNQAAKCNDLSRIIIAKDIVHP